MKIEILMLLESEIKGNNPTILNEDDDLSSKASANKFKNC